MLPTVPTNTLHWEPSNKLTKAIASIHFRLANDYSCIGVQTGLYPNLEMECIVIQRFVKKSKQLQSCLLGTSSAATKSDPKHGAVSTLSFRDTALHTAVLSHSIVFSVNFLPPAHEIRYHFLWEHVLPTKVFTSSQSKSNVTVLI